MKNRGHQPLSRVVHPDGGFSVTYCACGNVTVQVGDMQFRLDPDDYMQFARTVAVGFEKIARRPAADLGNLPPDEATMRYHSDVEHDVVPKVFN